MFNCSTICRLPPHYMSLAFSTTLYSPQEIPQTLIAPSVLCQSRVPQRWPLLH